ncbi:MAG TPA: hypothetical protein VK210_00345 [Terriglobia bacterium]|nr:hypothetical protein [Terriglobia bacterium]
MNPENRAADKAETEDHVPLSVANARRARAALRPYYWISLGSIILLVAALLILTYRMGVQSCLNLPKP